MRAQYPRCQRIQDYEYRAFEPSEPGRAGVEWIDVSLGV